MADGVLSFPFRITPTGAAATVGIGTDAEYDEAIAVLCLTHVGERPMLPEYGIPDPAFAGLHAGDVQVGLNDYGPENIKITNITLTPKSDRQSIADIEWAHDTEGDAADE